MQANSEDYCVYLCLCRMCQCEHAAQILYRNASECILYCFYGSRKTVALYIVPCNEHHRVKSERNQPVWRKIRKREHRKRQCSMLRMSREQRYSMLLCVTDATGWKWGILPALPHGRSETYRYDRQGRLSAHTDRKGRRLLHSDQGYQYTSKAFVEFCESVRFPDTGGVVSDSGRICLCHV